TASSPTQAIKVTQWRVLIGPPGYTACAPDQRHAPCQAPAAQRRPARRTWWAPGYTPVQPAAQPGLPLGLLHLNQPGRDLLLPLVELGAGVGQGLLVAAQGAHQRRVIVVGQQLQAHVVVGGDVR